MRWALAAVAGGALSACDVPAPAPAPPPAPPDRPELVAELRADLQAPRHASDGGGRAWIVSGGDAVAGAPGRWSIAYEAGPAGVAEGGAVALIVPLFWGWSAPQLSHPQWPGYTEVVSEAEGVALDVVTPEAWRREGGMVLAVVRGRALAEGERVRFDYGAGPAGARADRYAERGSAFWIAVDGDGDGVRALVAECPAITVRAGPPARLVATITSRARPGDKARLTVAALDEYGNAGVDIDVTLQVEATGLAAPSRIDLRAAEGAVRTMEVRVLLPGIHRVELSGPGGLQATSNPIEVSEAAVPVLWADLHGHSNVSDGTGLPEDWFRYARDVAALDVAVLTDHDHWGMRFLDADPAAWEAIRGQVDRFHDPGRFVTLLGYEWTSWLHGHRHVVWFEDGGQVFSSLDEATETPTGLWAALAGRRALTFAHHSAGGPIATDWSFVPDPRIEPVTEIVSVHGSSEALDGPATIYEPVPGNFVRDVLDRGLRFGFVGSGDGHDGHPGLAHLAGAVGGLAALVGAEPTRDSVLETLRARRTYATTGARMLLDARLDGAPMGGRVSPGARGRLEVRVAGTAPVQAIEIVRGGRGPGAVVASLDGWEGEDARGVIDLRDLQAGEYVYARVTQSDGHVAWSSPFFVGDG